MKIKFLHKTHWNYSM